MYTQHALFDAESEAAAALRDIESAGFAEGEYRIVMHKGDIAVDDMPHSESHARGGLLSGLVIGLVGGAILGALLAGPLHLLPVGIGVGALVCAVAGMVVAGLGASLYGSGMANPTVDRLRQQLRPGRVLLTAESASLSTREAIEQIIRRHGAAPA